MCVKKDVSYLSIVIMYHLEVDFSENPTTLKLGYSGARLFSHARPFLFLSACCFQYRYMEEGSVDLGLLYVNYCLVEI